MEEEGEEDVWEVVEEDVEEDEEVCYHPNGPCLLPCLLC